MSLEKLIQEKKSELQGRSLNSVLDCFDLDSCSTLDNSGDEYIQERVKMINAIIEPLNVDDDKYHHAFHLFNEAVYYEQFKSEGIDIEPLADALGNGPTFKIKDDSSELLVELKTLSFSDDHYREIQKDIAHCKNPSPLYKEYADYSPRKIVELMIDKISKDIVGSAFNLGDTILLIDCKQLMEFRSLADEVVPFYLNGRPQSSCIISGLLWNTVFTQTGSIYLKDIEDEGGENVDGYADISGLLTQFYSLNAVMLGCYEKGKNRKLVGFHRHEDKKIGSSEFFNTVCEYVNDDKNSNGYEYIEVN